MDDFDLIIIGAGSGGITAARFAAQLGAKVALVEKDRIGGDCTWTGCVPSKALIWAAKAAHTAKTGAQFGVVAGNVAVNMKGVHDYIQTVIQEIYQHESPEKMEKSGIDVALGPARFIAPNLIQVGDRRLRGKKFIIATGAHPHIPPINGIERVPYLTYEHFFDNERLPERLVVIGAGAVGCELGQAYRRLGAEVTLIDEAILPRFDRAAAAVISHQFEREGIDFVPALAAQIEYENDLFHITANSGDQIRGDMLLLATGRNPNVAGMDLDNAGVDFSDQGIAVDERLQTSAPHVYAIGDCIGREQSTHYAGWMAAKAVRNALLPGGAAGISDAPPMVVYTDPVVAQVGLRPSKARERGDAGIQTARLDNSQNDRAIIEGKTAGHIELTLDKKGVIIGATVVAPHGGEIINELSVAIAKKLRINEISYAIHAYPTYGISAQILAGEQTLKRMMTGALAKPIRYLAKR